MYFIKTVKLAVFHMPSTNDFYLHMIKLKRKKKQQSQSNTVPIKHGQVLWFDWHLFCLLVDMIPENALEEMTKNMDPNLVIVETKNGVQMK